MSLVNSQKSSDLNSVDLYGSLIDCSEHQCGTSFYYQILNPKLITKPNMIVKSVTIGDNKDKIQFLKEIVFKGTEVHYLPHNFPSPYKEIIKLTIWGAKLKEIHRIDIAQFQKLKTLNLRDNELEVIEEDFFKSNRIIEKIELQRNKIWFIGENSFKNLILIKFLDIGDNFCISGQWNDKSLINDDANEKCSKSHFMAQQNEILRLREDFNDLNEKIDGNFEDHTGIFLIILSIFVFISFVMIFVICCVNKKKISKLNEKIKRLDGIIANVSKNLRENCREWPTISVNDYEQPVFRESNMYAQIVDIN